MEILIIYTIIFFIILITLMILYISLNPLEIKEKKIENFLGYEEDVIKIYEPTDFQGISPDTYDVRNVPGTNEKYIIFKKNSSVRFPVDFPNCQILVVGGGGAGTNQLGGGGGGGAVIHIKNANISAGTYNIMIGNGGQVSGTKGYNSSFGGIIAEGGGSGGIFGNDNNRGGVGGSGGGAPCDALDGTPYTYGGVKGTSSTLNGFSGIIYGNNGGDGLTRSGGFIGAGGGGGAGENGGNGNINLNGEGGKGGNGILINITGTDLYWGGGGGGSSYFRGANKGGNGGLGGGGGGSCGNGNGTIGTGGGSSLNNGSSSFISSLNGGTGGANTGGGGGGGGWWNGSGWGGGGNGGSGVVIIRYTPIKIEPPPPSTRNASIIDLNPPTEMNNIPTNKEPYTYFETISKITGSDNNYTQIGTTEDNENYNISFSSYVNEEKSPSTLFSFDSTISNNQGAEFKPKRYNQKTGEFDSSLPAVPIFFNIQGHDGKIYTINNLNPIVDGKVAGPSINGEWISIKFPKPFALVSYSFVANLGWENKAPGGWSVLGRINNTNSSSNIPYNFIHTVSNRVSWERYGNKAQTLIEYLPNNKELYNEYIFIFTRLASTDIIQNIRHGHQLHFKEIKMYGRAVITEN